ncbi:Predicted transcriptional regulator, contains HTH domain [Lachnospiraceae bacterium C10]|nr:Predicted transcriptional regulator, contains HTH domain [Lachnospiraceae bacterium C10]
MGENFEKIIRDLCANKDEHEWYEFKENWYEPVALGEYVSALSNAAAFHRKKYGYFVWGINNDSHEIVGTVFDQYVEYKSEPYQNYLARNLSPSLNFKFEDGLINGKKIVLLIVPAATEIPTAFRDNRFIRIGSSKANLKDYPKREVELFEILSNRTETVENMPAKYQDLTFSKLFGYYGSKGIVLKEKTFEKNLGLLTEESEYNLLAQLLSDNSHFPLRISIFEGKTKGSNLFSVREFGNNCLLYTLDEVLRYGDVINVIQVDETNRVVERKEVPFFDNKAFREAVINAVLHNLWVSGNEPMISVFSDRIEILSRGAIPKNQTKEGFFSGESVPVNAKLSEIFLQLHISEKSGRGVPKITEVYGKDAFTFRENSIVVTIPFNRLKDGKVGNKIGNKVGNTGAKKIARGKSLNKRREQILNEMRDNPNVTTAELHLLLEISETAVENNITFLKENGYIERVGAKKNGYWRVL